mmetsp:Transcript_19036/g.44753  ORF Transcript_19036/g.44753 Transcript_19036/m.44753 type:complete len:444 (-) Transcript_19036:89-1420(-)
MPLFLRFGALFLAVAAAITLPREAQVPTDRAAATASLSGPGGAAEQMEEVLLSMAASPGDLAAQLDGCTTLESIVFAHSQSGLFFGKHASTALLEAGIGEVLAKGLLNAVAAEVASGLRAPGAASETCFSGILSLNVHNDYSRGLALISHAPTLWPAIMSFFRAFKGSVAVDVELCSLAGLFGTPQPSQAAALMVEAGAIDFVMEYFEKESLKSDPVLFQRVFCALSDPVHESSGVVARAIANYQGPLQGIPKMVQALRWAKESGSTFHEENGYGLLYEGVHDVGGILEHDDANHSFAKSFLQAGLVEQLVPIMRKEPRDRLLQDMSCEVVKWITDDNVAVQTQLVEMGVLEIIAEALKQHSHPPFLGYGAVTIACSTALLNFASTSEAWRLQLRNLGVYDTLTLDVLIAFQPFVNTDFIMRKEWFPNSNVRELKRMLGPLTG